MDQLGRPEEAEAAALARAKEADAEIVDSATYRAPAPSGGRVIAVVQGEGRDRVRPGPTSQRVWRRAMMNSDEIAASAARSIRR